MEHGAEVADGGDADCQHLLDVEEGGLLSLQLGREHFAPVVHCRDFCADPVDITMKNFRPLVTDE